MSNLRNETLEVLSEYGKSWDDVLVICGESFQITKEQFLQLSDIEYYEGFGCQEVASDLMIVGKDFWLERYEYDGAEHWEYKTMPDITNKPFIKINTLVCDYKYGIGATLQEMNMITDDEILIAKIDKILSE